MSSDPLPRISQPSSFAQRILANEAPGGPPASVILVAPTIVGIDESFALRISLADDQGYPSVESADSLRVRSPSGRSLADITFRPGQPAVVTIEGVRLAEAGLYRFEADLDGATFHSNPVCCQVSPTERIYWGDPHVHTVLSDCHAIRCRSLNFCYTAARHFAALNWASAADHVSNGRCELARWKEERAASEAYNDSPRFVTLPAYEASFRGGKGGDNNIYMARWPDMFVDDYESGSVRTACEKLGDALTPGAEFIAVPHHTTRAGKHGEIPDDIYPGEDVMPVVEIHSKWGTSEYRGNPTPLEKIHPGPSYVVDLLNRGLRLGFVGGTDTHSTMPAGFGDDHLDSLPGMTAVCAPELTRQTVFDAIRQRNCYATALERIYLAVDLNDARPGRTLAAFASNATRRVRVTAAAQSTIKSVDLVRNGETIRSVPVDDWHTELDLVDDEDLAGHWLPSPALCHFAYYYVRVTCHNLARAWSSPVWLVKG